jgi:hypothetical protein
MMKDEQHFLHIVFTPLEMMSFCSAAGFKRLLEFLTRAIRIEGRINVPGFLSGFIQIDGWALLYLKTECSVSARLAKFRR